MSWKEVVADYRKLTASRDDGSSFAPAWAEFQQTVSRNNENPPYHLRQLLKLLREHPRSAEPETIMILDHGCGGCLTLLYLLALGYTGIHGINIGGKCEDWNRLLKELFGIEEKRLTLYDGKTMPFADNSIDIVFSQQVIEHVKSDVLETFYSEEARVMRPGSIAYHQVPHRSVPYESHTRVWFAHYLPLKPRLRIYGWLGLDVAYIEDQIHLRWPSEHMKMAKRHIGATKDITLDRMRIPPDANIYDGPLGPRKLICAAVRLPVLGALFGMMLKPLIMLESISVREEKP